jgi:hypothetical protein
MDHFLYFTRTYIPFSILYIKKNMQINSYLITIDVNNSGTYYAVVIVDKESSAKLTNSCGSHLYLSYLIFFIVQRMLWPKESRDKAESVTLLGTIWSMAFVPGLMDASRTDSDIVVLVFLLHRYIEVPSYFRSHCSIVKLLTQTRTCCAEREHLTMNC